MLTENEKKIMRLLISKNPTSEYMSQLAANDEFARNEIKKNIGMLISERSSRIITFTAQKERADRDIAQAQQELQILQSVE